MTYKTEVLKMAFEIDNDFESTVQIKVIGVGGGGVKITSRSSPA